MMAPWVRRTWAPKGHTPVLYQKTQSHRKVSIIAAITVPPQRQRIGLYFSLHTNANIKAHRVVRFLKQLGRDIQKPMLIIWDRFMAHRAKTVKTLIQRRSKLHMAFLPPYAPELNPTEIFWGYLKNNSLANFPAPNLQVLSTTARYHAVRIKRRQNLLRSFLYATPLFSRPK
jgi:transposase